MKKKMKNKKNEKRLKTKNKEQYIKIKNNNEKQLKHEKQRINNNTYK